MKKVFLACGLMALGAMAAELKQPAFQMKEADLLEVVRSSTNLNDKVTACQELCHTGADAAVPTLAALLADKSDAALFHAALYALQNIPGVAAESALKSAQANCTGVRRDAIATTLRLRATPVAAGYAGDAPSAPIATPLQRGDASLLPALVEAACARRDADARRALIGFPSSSADGYLVRLLDGQNAALARFAAVATASRLRRARR